MFYKLQQQANWFGGKKDYWLPLGAVSTEREHKNIQGACNILHLDLDDDYTDRFTL